MRPSVLFAAFVVLLCIVNAASAVLLDYKDVATGTTADVGDTITTNGFTIAFTDYVLLDGALFSGGQAGVYTFFLQPGQFSDPLLCLEDVNAVFDFTGLPWQVTQMQIRLIGIERRVNLHINPDNGGDVISTSQFWDGLINGQTINGVSVSVTGDSSGRWINFSGPIDELWIGGNGLNNEPMYLGPVTFTPEPGAGLLIVGGAVIAALRPRRTG